MATKRFNYINTQEITGFVGKDPVLRFMPNQDAVLDLSVATTHSWKDKDGNWHDETEWFNCIFYRKAAEEVAALVKKGSAIFVKGRTYTRKWTAKDGAERTRREVIVDLYGWHLIQHEKNSAFSEAPTSDEPPINNAGFDETPTANEDKDAAKGSKKGKK